VLLVCGRPALVYGFQWRQFYLTALATRQIMYCQRRKVWSRLTRSSHGAMALPLPNGCVTLWPESSFLGHETLRLLISKTLLRPRNWPVLFLLSNKDLRWAGSFIVADPLLQHVKLVASIFGEILISKFSVTYTRSPKDPCGVLQKVKSYKTSQCLALKENH